MTFSLSPPFLGDPALVPGTRGYACSCLDVYCCKQAEGRAGRIVNFNLLRYGIDFLIENKELKKMYKDMNQLSKELEAVMKKSDKLKTKYKVKK